MPCRIEGDPAGRHHGVAVEVVGGAIDGDVLAAGAVAVVVAVLPAIGAVGPGAAVAQGFIHVEVDRVLDVVIGAGVLVAALGGHRDLHVGGVADQVGGVVGTGHERDLITLEGARAGAGHGFLVADLQRCLGDGAGDRGAHVDGTRDRRVGQRTPVGNSVVGVLEAAKDGLRLVLEDGGQGVDEASAAVFLTVLGCSEAVVGVAGLLLEQGDGLVGGVVRVDLLDQRGHARSVRGGHRGAGQVAEGRILLPGRQGRPDARAGGGHVHGVLAVVGELGTLELRDGGVGAGGQRDGGHGDDRVVEHGGHVDAAGHVALDCSALDVVGRCLVDRRVVMVVVVVTLGGDVDDAVVFRVADRARGSFEARSLGALGGHPEGVGVHVVAGVRHVNVVLGSPVEGAGHVLGVEGAGLVRGLDRDNRGAGGDAVHTVGVVRGGDGTGDVRAVVVVILPVRGGLARDAVDLAAHGTRGVQVLLEVLVVRVDAGVHDADGDLLEGDVDLLGLERADGGQAPGVGVALVGGEVVELGVGGQAGRAGTRGVSDGVGLGRGGLRLLGAHLGAGDRLVAGGANRLVGDTGVDEALAERRREGGLHRLDEEGVEFGVLGQDHAVFRGLGDGRVEVVVGGVGGQVDRVVHDLVLGASLRGDPRGAGRMRGGAERGERDADSERRTSRDEGLP